MQSADTPFSPALWRALRHEWLWVYRSRSATEEVWSPEITVPAGVFFVETGQVKIRVGGVSQVVLPGQAFFSAPGLREHYFARGTRLCSVGCRNQWPDGSPLFQKQLSRVVQKTEASALLRATLRLFQTVHRGRKQVSYQAATAPAERSLPELCRHDAAFLQWFAVYVDTLTALGIPPDDRQGRHKDKVELLQDWLNGLPLDKAGPLVPPGLGIGTRRADQLLQSHTGLGLKRYHTHRRLLAAKRMLLADGVSMKEIVFELGFRHASHFTSWFRRHAGMPPSVFKKCSGVDVA